MNSQDFFIVDQLLRYYAHIVVTLFVTRNDVYSHYLIISRFIVIVSVCRKQTVVIIIVMFSFQCCR